MRPIGISPRRTGVIGAPRRRRSWRQPGPRRQRTHRRRAVRLESAWNSQNINGGEELPQPVEMAEISRAVAKTPGTSPGSPGPANNRCASGTRRRAPNNSRKPFLSSHPPIARRPVPSPVGTSRRRAAARSWSPISIGSGFGLGIVQVARGAGYRSRNSCRSSSLQNSRSGRLPRRRRNVRDSIDPTRRDLAPLQQRPGGPEQVGSSRPPGRASQILNVVHVR